MAKAILNNLYQHRLGATYEVVNIIKDFVSATPMVVLKNVVNQEQVYSIPKSDFEHGVVITDSNIILPSFWNVTATFNTESSKDVATTAE